MHYRKVQKPPRSRAIANASSAKLSAKAHVESSATAAATGDGIAPRPTISLIRCIGSANGRDASDRIPITGNDRVASKWCLASRANRRTRTVERRASECSFEWGSTTVGDASATCVDGRQRDGAVEARGRTADRDRRPAWDPGWSMVPGASSRSPRVHARSGARAARARVARAANPAAVAAAGVADAREALRSVRHQDTRRAASHRAASHTPVALLSARRRLCCRSVRSPRIRSRTSSDRRMSRRSAGPGCSSRSGSKPCRPRSLSSAAASVSRTCTRARSRSPPAASPAYLLASTARTPAIKRSRLVRGVAVARPDGNRSCDLCWESNESVIQRVCLLFLGGLCLVVRKRFERMLKKCYVRRRSMGYSFCGRETRVMDALGWW